MRRLSGQGRRKAIFRHGRKATIKARARLVLGKTQPKRHRHVASPATVREIAQSLPGAEESTSYGTPAFKVRGKLFARLHQDGESLVVGVNFEEREEMMSADPEKFYITDHYRNFPWMLVRLTKVRSDQLRDLPWRRVAPKQLKASLHKFGL